MRKVVGLVALTATASVVLALGGPGALMPFKAAAVAVEEVSVAFVVDFGGGNVKAACVKVPSTDNEYQALAAFTQQENEATPTYSDSGLLCSIGNVPTSGCGQADGRGYIYWSYWHGDSGAWTYSNSGASGTVHTCNAQGQDCDVEGWRFENPGAGNPTDPPPATAPNYSAICPPSPPPTTTSTGPPAPTTTPTSPTTTLRSPSTTAAPGSPSSTSPPTSSAGPTTGGPGTTTTTAGLSASTASSGSSGASPSSSTGSSSGPASVNPVPPSTSSGALASTGFGWGDRWMGAIGATLLLLGIGFFLVEDAPRRVRRVLVDMGPGSATRSAHIDAHAEFADLVRLTRRMATNFRTLEGLVTQNAGRFGRWVLGR